MENHKKSSLISKNIKVCGRRTSVRLEPEMWNELKNISKRESCTIHDLCSLIALRKDEKTSLTAAIRVFLMLYFRAAATENGHVRAGHGNFVNMKQRAGMQNDWSASKMVANMNKTDKRLLSSEKMDSRLAAHLPNKDAKSNTSSHVYWGK